MAQRRRLQCSVCGIFATPDNMDRRCRRENGTVRSHNHIFVIVYATATRVCPDTGRTIYYWEKKKDD